MNIGVFGGTFDPVHRAHIAVAEKVKWVLSCSEVLFIPAGCPWLKAGEKISPAPHRVEMLRLAINGRPGFSLSLMEIERPGPTYTVDTLTELRKTVNPCDALYFIMGWDSLNSLPRWREPSRIIQLARLVVVPRPGFPAPDMQALEAAIPGINERILLLDEPQLDVSAHEIRARVERGLPIADLVPDPVAQYIEDHKLYRDEY